MQDASSVLKNSKGKRATETKNKSDFFHLHSSKQLIFIADFIVFPLFLLLQFNFLENTLLPLQYGLHRAKVFLVNFSLSEDVFVECVGDKAIPKSAFVVVKSRIDNGSIDEDKFACIFISVENGRFILQFFGEVAVVDI